MSGQIFFLWKFLFKSELQRVASLVTVEPSLLLYNQHFLSPLIFKMSVLFAMLDKDEMLSCELCHTFHRSGYPCRTRSCHEERRIERIAPQCWRFRYVQGVAFQVLRRFFNIRQHYAPCISTSDFPGQLFCGWRLDGLKWAWSTNGDNSCCCNKVPLRFCFGNVYRYSVSVNHSSLQTAW